MRSLANTLLTIIVLFIVGCSENNSKKEEAKSQAQTYTENIKLEEEIGARARAMFKALPAIAETPQNVITDSKVKLGKILYYDNRLSKNQTQSCNTCHNLATFGVDNKPKSEGDLGGLGDRNSPTVYNSALHTVQFWDGRAKDVEQQAGMPITNPVEMNIPNEKFLVDRLAGVEMYRQLFAEAFPNVQNPISYQNIELAIAAFERTLQTPSKFDKYLEGQQAALSLDEKKGMKTFMDVGCITCHTGALLGGNMFQKFGVNVDYWEYTNSDPIDEGRFKETANETDKYMFKVPSLRNISKTSPYFHDGSVEKLDDAVRIIA